LAGVPGWVLGAGAGGVQGGVAVRGGQRQGHRTGWAGQTGCDARCGVDPGSILHILHILFPCRCLASRSRATPGPRGDGGAPAALRQAQDRRTRGDGALCRRPRLCSAASGGKGLRPLLPFESPGAGVRGQNGPSGGTVPLLPMATFRGVIGRPIGRRLFGSRFTAPPLLVNRQACEPPEPAPRQDGQHHP